jgi:hypothetical protein
VNQPNKEGQPSAEVGEERAQTRENIVQSHMHPTQNGKRMSQRKNSFACLAGQLPLGTRTKRGHASCVTVGSDPTNFFGRLKAEKAQSLPPNLVVFSVSLFSFSCRLFPRFPETYAHPKLKKMLKTKLK